MCVTLAETAEDLIEVRQAGGKEGAGSEAAAIQEMVADTGRSKTTRQDRRAACGGQTDSRMSMDAPPTVVIRRQGVSP